jgi:murein L,D-transpeptidase YafK
MKSLSQTISSLALISSLVFPNHGMAEDKRSLESPIFRQLAPLESLIEVYKRDNPGEVEKKIIVDKSDRTLGVYVNDILFRQYPISLGQTPIGDKERRGDMKTPEGTFYVANKLPNSSFYLALVLSYPNKEDAARGLKSGLVTKKQKNLIDKRIDKCQIPPQRSTRLGGMIEIHGNGGGRQYGDWTWGCIAVNDTYMEELFNFAESGCNKNGKHKTTIIVHP